MKETKPGSLSKGIILVIVGIGLLVGGVVFWLTSDISRQAENSNASSSPVQNSPTNEKPESPQQQGGIVTRTGEMVCLPPKDPSGIHDMSCALGIKSGTEYYALAGGTDQLIGIPTGQPISVTGTLTQPKQDKYNIVGTITVQSITKQ